MSIERGMAKKMCIYITCNRILFSHEIMLFEAMWMDLEIIILGEIGQIEKDKYFMESLICRI